MHTNSVSFKAIPVSNTKIPIKNAGKWIKEEVSFVRFNPRLNADKKTLNEVAQLWENKNMSGAIAEEAEILKDPVYALVRQNSDYKNIDARNVLGIFSTDRIKPSTDAVEIYKLGTNPEFAYEQNHRQRDIKHIGSAMIKEFLKYIDKNTNVKKVTIGSEPESVKFYQRMNFPERKDSVNVFETTKDMFKTIIS